MNIIGYTNGDVLWCEDVYPYIVQLYPNLNSYRIRIYL